MLRIYFISLMLLIGHFMQGQSLKEIALSNDLTTLKNFLNSNDLNKCVDGVNPIIGFSSVGNVGFVEYLIDKGADVNAQCKWNRTALMMAVKRNDIEMVKLLVENGADITRKDTKGETALDMAMKLKLDTIISEVFEKEMAQFAEVDGPYIVRNEMSVTSIQFLRNKDQKIEVIRDKVSVDDLSDQKYTCYGTDGLPLFNFTLEADEEFEPDNSYYREPDRLVAISDIEGNLDAFVNLLKANKVVDEKLNWAFGEGHLVLVGDYFDRGKYVTEGLWLAYKLDKEAEKAGGKVHFIIGNHEEMNLSGDLRYVQRKYIVNAHLAGLEYLDLYGENTVLGKWLRSKNSIVKIGDYLFCHGGLSPEFIGSLMTMKSINKTTRKYLDKSFEEKDKDDRAGNVFSSLGPLWYRGHILRQNTQEEVDAVLKYFRADHLIIGHTPVEKITPIYNNKIIGIDVPHIRGPKYQRALLIEDEHFFSLDTEGNKTKLF